MPGTFDAHCLNTNTNLYNPTAWKTAQIELFQRSASTDTKLNLTISTIRTYFKLDANNQVAVTPTAETSVPVVEKIALTVCQNMVRYVQMNYTMNTSSNILTTQITVYYSIRAVSSIGY